jgi:hypothetical protein
MGCCGNPTVRLTRRATIQPSIRWADNCTVQPAQRQIQWAFRVNGVTRYLTAWGVPTAALSIGSGSTYSVLNGTNQQIVDFLVGQGVSVVAGNTIEVYVNIRNCERERATSNTVRFVAPAPSSSSCDCSWVFGYTSGQTGNTAVPPGGYVLTGGELVTANGMLNPNGRNYAANPLSPADELAFVTLDSGCAESLTIVNATGLTGASIPVPLALSAQAANQNMIVVRNGAFELVNGVSFGNVALNPSVGPALATDQFTFFALTVGDCVLETVVVGLAANGLTISLPSGYTAANQNKWLLVRTGLLGYDAAQSVSGYSVVGSTVTFETALSGEDVWLIAIA